VSVIDFMFRIRTALWEFTMSAGVGRRWRTAGHRGQGAGAAAFARSLHRIVDDDIVMAAAISEPNST
jgi:hypothetical protein